MSHIDALQNLIQEKLAEINSLHDKLEKAINDEENAKRIKEYTEKWYAEENDKAIREAEQKRVLDEEKKVQDAIEKRRVDAEAMETITIEQAHNDLFTNKETPFVFRKYIRDFANAIVKPSNLEYMDEGQWLQDYKYPECGRMLRQVMGCEHLTAREYFNPKGYSGGDIEWTYKYIVISMGACSSWCGHTGYCWEGSYANCALGALPDQPQGKYWKALEPVQVEEPAPQADIIPVTLTIAELKKLKHLVPLETTGVFRDSDNHRLVTGPVEDIDEDVEGDYNYTGKKYVVGEKTSRVYEVCETGDVFAGFNGIGKFKNLVKRSRRK